MKLMDWIKKFGTGCDHFGQVEVQAGQLGDLIKDVGGIDKTDGD